MTIRYVTTRSDLFFVSFRSLVRNRFLRVCWAVIVVAICYAGLHEPRMAVESLGYKIAYCVIAAVAYLAIFVSLMLALMTARVLTGKHMGVLGEHRLSISDEGLLESTVHNESLNRWSAYHQTVSTRSYLLLYVTEGQFHVVSRKRPLLEGDLPAFEAILREKTRKA